MYKNIVIIILVFLLCSLCFQNKENVDIIIGNIAETTEKVVSGTTYLKESFDRNFSEKKIKIDIPSLQIQKEPFTEGLMTGKIEEDTFFKEEK
jgi:hypothetical protein